VWPLSFSSSSVITFVAFVIAKIFFIAKNNKTKLITMLDISSIKYIWSGITLKYNSNPINKVIMDDKTSDNASEKIGDILHVLFFFIL